MAGHETKPSDPSTLTQDFHLQSRLQELQICTVWWLDWPQKYQICPTFLESSKSNLISAFGVYLFAGEPHKHIPHDALPLALEHTFLESVEELEVLLDQKPQRAGKRTEDSEKETLYRTLALFYKYRIK